MKGYTIFPNQTPSLFSPNDVYTLVGLYFTADQNYKTDVTYEQLYKLTGQSIDYIRKGFSNRLADSNFCGITYTTNVTDKVRTRKHYSLPKPTTNFRFIQKEIFEDKSLTSEEKGFLISLYCNCVNNSFSLGLSVNELSTKIKIKKSSFYTLRNSLLKKGYIHKIRDMPLFFRSEDFSEDYMLTCPWLGYESYQMWIEKNQYERYED